MSGSKFDHLAARQIRIAAGKRPEHAAIAIDRSKETVLAIELAAPLPTSLRFASWPTCTAARSPT